MLTKRTVSVTLAATYIMLSSHLVFAQSGSECIEKVERPTACDHVIIKVADPRIIQSSNILQSPVCICLSDFPSVFADSQSSSGAMPTLEEKVILDSWQLTLSDLSQLLRY